jgi:dGTPase
LDQELARKQMEPAHEIHPTTLEGCVVRMADTISYIGRDIEDAIRLGLIMRADIPGDVTKILGDTNGTIVYTLVEDLVANSLDKPHVSFSPEVAEALGSLKTFNQERIYQNPVVKEQTGKIRLMFHLLFQRYLEDLETGNEQSRIYTGFLEGMLPHYQEQTPSAGIVRDFIAGMTDEYFLTQCYQNLVPQIKTGRP